MARLRLELPKLKTLAEKRSQIETAEFRKADLEVARNDVQAQGKAGTEAWQKKEVARNDVINKEESALFALESEIDTEAENKLKTAQEEIRKIEAVTLPAIETEIQARRDRIAQLQGELSRMAEAETELKTVQAERDQLVRETSEWKYLQAACSKNGLQALEIDGAAPLITGYANQLLAGAFGPLFTVKFRTQDDEGREVLDIVVIGEDGEEILLENLSGGQKVWILKALRLAMTLLSKEKSGRNFETFFSDEEDGALDVDNARNFIALYEAFMKMGGFKAGYFISHKPECRALAANTLVFEPGKNPEWR
jgi:DNA repair exonuclease SbcCD ATPase subunit